MANRDYGVAAYEGLDDETPSWGEIGDEELERLRIHAGTPRFGREIDERVLPAEAGLDRTAIDFERAAPGVRSPSRASAIGAASTVRCVFLALEGDKLPAYDAELDHEGKVSAESRARYARDDHVLCTRVRARVEVPARRGALLGDRGAAQLDLQSLPP